MIEHKNLLGKYTYTEQPDITLHKECIMLYLLNRGEYRISKRGRYYVKYKRNVYAFYKRYFTVNGYRLYAYDFFKFLLMIHGKKSFSFNHQTTRWI